MKVVQTTLTEAEHKLLEEYAKRNAMSIKDVLREAIKIKVEGNVDPNDPIFTCPPSSKRTGKKDRGSEKHDKYLYREYSDICRHQRGRRTRQSSGVNLSSGNAI